MNERIHLNISQSPSIDWSHYQKKLGCNIYHSAEWGRTIDTDHQQPLYFSWFDANQCIGFGVGVQRWSPLPLVGRNIKHLNFESYPIVKDNSPQKMRIVLQQLLDFAKRLGFLSLTINSFLTDIDISNCHELGFRCRERREFAIDLTLSDEDLFKQLATRHKRKVKKAKKHGMRFQEAESMAAMREFRKLQIQSRDRRMQRGEFIGMMDDAYYEKFAKTHFKEKLGRVFLMTHGDQPVSAAFVSIYGGKAYYTYGGSSDEGFRMDAPPLLFLNIFTRCRELGCTEFNLGGVPASSVEQEQASHGLYLFKAGFGGREIICRNLSADSLRPILNGVVNAINKIRGR